MAVKEPAIHARTGMPEERVAENTLDMANLLTAAYELGDLINLSADAADYLYWKKEVERDEAAQLLVKRFAKSKEKFEECQRFGRFHPDFNAAKDEVAAIQKQLDGQESVRNFKGAEQALDELLHEVSRTIASAVSEQIKVPGNDPLPSGGCGSGGSCSCGSGGCG